jgi:Na+-transporting NADH:ubiquinone oxidoreductase subunit NqrB
MDPRRYQIAALTALVVYGLFGLNFDVRPSIAATLFVTMIAAQWCGWRVVFSRSTRTDYKSAIISALSLCLLLRTSSLLVAAVAAALTISSKFIIRVGGKHVFNPTNFGIVAALLLTSSAWVSPGQWGDAAFFAFLVACVGIVVVTRAARADVTITFLFAYATLLVARSLWLGEPLTIPLHRLQNGALLIFAFFMISDPKTTPDARVGRIVFAVIVALGAYYVHFRLFRPNGLLWSLAAASPLVPLIDSVHGGCHVQAETWSHRLRSALVRGSVVRLVRAPGGLLRVLRVPGGHEAVQPRVAGRARP